MDTGIQLGRRFRALKLWMILRYFGAEGLRARLVEHVRLARLFADWVDVTPGWERVAPVPFAVVCFRYRPPGVDDEAALERLNAALMDRVNRSGEAFLSHTKLDGRYVIRIAIGNIRTTEAHVARAWALLQERCRSVSLRWHVFWDSPRTGTVPRTLASGTSPDGGQSPVHKLARGLKTTTAKEACPMRRLLALVLIGGGMLALPAQAWADGFISPYFGVNFSGDTTKNSTVFGGSLGFLGKSAGFEVDFGYTPDFFGDDTLDVDGKTATLMANVLVGGRHHTVSPYIALGAGLIRTDITGPSDVLDLHATENNWGGNIGAGCSSAAGR
jgi:aromatic-L-amino-acid decarboxylase